MKAKTKYTLDMIAPIFNHDHTYTFRFPELNLPKCKRTIIVQIQ